MGVVVFTKVLGHAKSQSPRTLRVLGLSDFTSPRTFAKTTTPIYSLQQCLTHAQRRSYWLKKHVFTWFLKLLTEIKFTLQSWFSSPPANFVLSKTTADCDAVSLILSAWGSFSRLPSIGHPGQPECANPVKFQILTLMLKNLFWSVCDLLTFSCALHGCTKIKFKILTIYWKKSQRVLFIYLSWFFLRQNNLIGWKRHESLEFLFFFVKICSGQITYQQIKAQLQLLTSSFCLFL